MNSTVLCFIKRSISANLLKIKLKYERQDVCFEMCR